MDKSAKNNKTWWIVSALVIVILIVGSIVVHQMNKGDDNAPKSEVESAPVSEFSSLDTSDEDFNALDSSLDSLES